MLSTVACAISLCMAGRGRWRGMITEVAYFSELVRRLDVLNMTRYRDRFYSENTVSAFVFCTDPAKYWSTQIVSKQISRATVYISNTLSYACDI